MKIKINKAVFSFLFFIPLISFAQDNTETNQKTWTYTYLKAKENEKQNLKAFLIENWFAMDSIAVNQGLFNDYKLLENTNTESSADWDFIVAVEYFTAGTYGDIEKEWQTIRKNHKTVLIDGKGMRDLGGFVKSETVVDAYKKSMAPCNDNHVKMIEPFIGQWHEYLETDNGEELYGKLSIEIDHKGCGIKKEFQHLQQPFSYSTLGYFDKQKNKWVETYTFSNGAYAIYEWNQDGNDFLLSVTQSTFKRKVLSRNRWKVINKDSFQIIVEQSEDNGKSWQISSTTNMKRID